MYLTWGLESPHIEDVRSLNKDEKRPLGGGDEKVTIGGS